MILPRQKIIEKKNQILLDVKELVRWINISSAVEWYNKEDNCKGNKWKQLNGTLDIFDNSFFSGKMMISLSSHIIDFLSEIRSIFLGNNHFVCFLKHFRAVRAWENLLLFFEFTPICIEICCPKYDNCGVERIERWCFWVESKELI